MYRIHFFKDYKYYSHLTARWQIYIKASIPYAPQPEKMLTLNM
jgi:hypothetical protein